MTEIIKVIFSALDNKFWLYLSILWLILFLKALKFFVMFLLITKNFQSKLNLEGSLLIREIFLTTT